MWAFLFFATLHADTGGIELEDWDPYEQGVPPDWAVGQEELVVEGGHTRSWAKGELEGTLRTLGYGKRVRSGEWTVYFSKSPWYPKVMLHDSGMMMIRRRGVHFALPEVADWGGLEKPLELALCILQPTACIRVQGLLTSKRRLRWKEQEVVDATRRQLAVFQQAIAEESMKERSADLLEALHRLWRTGRRPADEGFVATHRERRAELVEQWIAPAANAWGDEVRQEIELFIDDVVQQSGHPFQGDEVSEANARRKTERRLQPVLPGSGNAKNKSLR